MKFTLNDNVDLSIKSLVEHAGGDQDKLKAFYGVVFRLVDLLSSTGVLKQECRDEIRKKVATLYCDALLGYFQRQSGLLKRCELICDSHYSIHLSYALEGQSINIVLTEMGVESAKEEDVVHA